MHALISPRRLVMLAESDSDIVDNSDEEVESDEVAAVD
jgi:hypothetical protein